MKTAYRSFFFNVVICTLMFFSYDSDIFLKTYHVLSLNLKTYDVEF